MPVHDGQAPMKLLGLVAALRFRGTIFVEALAHFLAGLEEGHALLVDRDMLTGTRVAAGSGGAMLDRERAEPTQLDPVALGHRRGDLAQDGVVDVLNVTLIAVRILGGDT